MTRGLFGPGTLVLGGGAVVLVVFLLVGLLLPGSWSARAEATLPADTDALLAWLDSPEGWSAWTPWPDSTDRTGPARGAGATIAWDSRELGVGSFGIDAAGPGGVAYSVRVAGDGGSEMRTSGRITLTPVDGGTRVSWVEEGDLGSNPLMGYWALAMDGAQSTELAKSLDRLAEIVDEAAAGGASGPALPPAAPSATLDSARTR